MNQEIDWDSVANEADNAPAHILKDLLDQAEDICALVTVWADADGMIHFDCNAPSVMMIIGMLEAAKYKVLKEEEVS